MLIVYLLKIILILFIYDFFTCFSIKTKLDYPSILLRIKERFLIRFSLHNCIVEQPAATVSGLE